MENQEVYNIENGVKEVTIIHKKALDEKAPVSIKIAGNIDSPRQWISQRIVYLYTEKSSHILVNRENLSICLIFNETDPHNISSVAGNLSKHPDFKMWRINTGESWGNDELSEFIKMNRHCFKSKSDAMKLAGELKNLKIKVDKEVEASNNNRGDVRVLMAQKVVENSLPKSFILTVPVFKGQDKQEFEVELYVNASTFQVTLVSPDSNDIVSSVRDNIINSELDKIKEIAPDIVIIEQ